MAAVTPELTTRGGGTAASIHSYQEGTGAHAFAGCKVQQWNFRATGVSDGDTWTTNMPDLVAVLWQGVNASDTATAIVTSQATGVVTFTTAEGGAVQGTVYTVRGAGGPQAYWG